MAVFRFSYFVHIYRHADVMENIKKTFIDTTNEGFHQTHVDVGLSCKGRKIKDNYVKHDSPITKCE